MTLIIADRVRQRTITTGTGNLSLLAGVPSSYQSFVSGVGNGNTCYYTCRHMTANQWESGICTVNSGSPDTLTRTAGNVLAGSSGAGVLVNFSAGTKDVFLSEPSARGITRNTSTALDPLIAPARGVPYAAGSFQLDTASTTLFVDATNGRAGIGNSSPLCMLDVAGTIRVTTQTAPATGSSIEIFYNTSGAGEGVVAAFNRSTTQYILLSLGDSIYVVAGAAANRFVGIGIQAAAAQCHVVTPDAATNTVTTVGIFGHDTSGTAAAGFGTGWKFQGQSSTTADRDMTEDHAEWQVATDASRTADRVFKTVNNAGALAEVLRLLGQGTIKIANSVAPAGTPSGGGYLYVEAGALKYKGSSGTITVLGVA